MPAMRIRSQLLLMATAVLIPVIVAAGLAIYKIREAEREAGLRGLRETARATALIVDREVQGSKSALRALAGSRNLEIGDLEAFYRQAAVFNEMPDVWTVLHDASGRQVFNTLLPYGTAPPPAHRAAVERIKRVLSNRDILITDLAPGTVTGKMLTTVNVPISSHHMSFVISQAFTVEHWRKKVMQPSLPSDWVVAVIDRNGRFISRSHRADELLGQPARPELVAAAGNSATGLIRHKTIEGVSSYDAYTHSDLTGWTIAVAAPVRSVEAAANSAVWLALAGIVLTVGVAGVAVAAFGSSFINAIEGASRAATALGKGLIPAMESTGIKEVNALNRALVGAGSLLDIERRGRQSAETERERLLSNETVAREAAQAQNEAKDQFLAMLGHELRNPLAAIAAATALLERMGATKPGAERFVQIISRQNRQLSHIVDDLLDVSRLLAGKIELELAPLDMADCVARAVEALLITERAAGYRIHVHASSVWFNGDAVRIDQILNNLLSNALKFSEPGGEVNVGVRAHAGRAVVTVQDGGAGIAAELLTRVFEPFVQGPAPANRLQSGLGVGLALVRQLVLLHGGEVEASSPGHGHGSTFTFWLPCIDGGPGKSSNVQAMASTSAEKAIADPGLPH
jgi:signal transduction histidine kinase